MTLSKDAYEKIVKKYPVLLVMEDDPAEAFDFVHDVLCAEADAIREKEPHATHIIEDLETAAYKVWDVGADVENEYFDECTGTT